MNATDLFLDLYKQLEETVRVTFELDDRDSISYYLSNRTEFRKYKEDIRYCQDVRNLLSHKRKINGSYAVEPSNEMINFIRNLINTIKKRQKCSDILIPFGKVFHVDEQTAVIPTVRTMRKLQYTQVPIVKNGCVTGVFDENSVFSYLAHSGSNTLADSLVFADIREFTSLDGRERQQFIFFAADRFVDELENEFERASGKGRRIGLAFITENGKREEKLLGIITPWDIIAAEE